MTARRILVTSVMSFKNTFNRDELDAQFFC